MIEVSYDFLLQLVGKQQVEIAWLQQQNAQLQALAQQPQALMVAPAEQPIPDSCACVPSLEPQP